MRQLLLRPEQLRQRRALRLGGAHLHPRGGLAPVGHVRTRTHLLERSPPELVAAAAAQRADAAHALSAQLGDRGGGGRDARGLLRRLDLGDEAARARVDADEDVELLVLRELQHRLVVPLGLRGGDVRLDGHVVVLLHVHEQPALQPHPLRRQPDAAERVGVVLGHVLQVVAREREDLDVREGDGLRVVDQVGVVEDDVLAPHAALDEEAPHLDHEAAAEDVEEAERDALLRDVRLDRQVLRDVRVEDEHADVRPLVGLRRLEVPHALEPLLVRLQRHLALQQRRHEREQLAVALDAVQLARVVEELAQLHAQLAGEPPLRHEVVERVEVRLEPQPLRVERRGDARGGADHIAPEDGGEEHHQAAHQPLEGVDGEHLAVADGRDRHQREVERGDVPLERTDGESVARVSILQLAQPRVRIVGLEDDDQSPQARLPVRPEAQRADERSELDHSVRHFHLRL
mmetsp:Transcript_22500/g.51481  ORF Transcript_22500/g.51481 Transcript_22500/m.51481 type:complete len:460 (+) Transcript_22500:295-1674(+)